MIPDEEIDRQLSAIERESADPDFTRRVLLRLDERESSSTAWAGVSPRWSWALAVLLLAVTFGGSSLWEHTQAKRELRGTLRNLETERRALAADFERLRRLEGVEVLYLGSDDRTDYLLDLNSRRAVSAQRTGTVVPASSVY